MVKFRNRLLAVAGIAMGIMTVQRLRKRRARSDETASATFEHDEPESASEHAKAAAEHARLAAAKAAERREA